MTLTLYYSSLSLIHISVCLAQCCNIYAQEATSIFPFSIYEVSVCVFVFMQSWKKRIQRVTCTSPVQITTRTTASMESVSTPISWHSPPAGKHTNMLHDLFKKFLLIEFTFYQASSHATMKTLYYYPSWSKWDTNVYC